MLKMEKIIPSRKIKVTPEIADVIEVPSSKLKGLREFCGRHSIKIIDDGDSNVLHPLAHQTLKLVPRKILKSNYFEKLSLGIAHDFEAKSNAEFPNTESHYSFSDKRVHWEYNFEDIYHGYDPYDEMAWTLLHEVGHPTEREILGILEGTDLIGNFMMVKREFAENKKLQCTSKKIFDNFFPDFFAHYILYGNTLRRFIKSRRKGIRNILEQVYKNVKTEVFQGRQYRPNDLRAIVSEKQNLLKIKRKLTKLTEN